MKDIKSKLSLLWIFLMFNYLYCDVMTLTDPIKQMGPQLTQEFLLGASILMQIPIAMVLFSRILRYRVNRWTNIISGVIMVIVQILTLFIGIPTLYYVFFSVIEIASASFIVWYAWKWKGEKLK
jgi:threonine/homoserine/homoserine lactone efflux protein